MWYEIPYFLNEERISGRNLKIHTLARCGPKFSHKRSIFSVDFEFDLHFGMGVRNSVLLEYGIPGRAVNPHHWAVFTQVFAYRLQILRIIRIWPSFWYGGTEFRTFRLGYGNPDGFCKSTHTGAMATEGFAYTPKLLRRIRIWPSF